MLELNNNCHILVNVHVFYWSVLHASVVCAMAIVFVCLFVTLVDCIKAAKFGRSLRVVQNIERSTGRLCIQHTCLLSLQTG